MSRAGMHSAKEGNVRSGEKAMMVRRKASTSMGNFWVMPRAEQGVPVSPAEAERRRWPQSQLRAERGSPKLLLLDSVDIAVGVVACA